MPAHAAPHTQNSMAEAKPTGDRRAAARGSGSGGVGGGGNSGSGSGGGGCCPCFGAHDSPGHGGRPTTPPAPPHRLNLEDARPAEQPEPRQQREPQPAELPPPAAAAPNSETQAAEHHSKPPSSSAAHAQGMAVEPDFVALQDVCIEEERQVPASSHACVVDRPASSHDGAVVVHAIPELKINGSTFQMQAERPRTPPLTAQQPSLPFSPAPIATPRGSPSKANTNRGSSHDDLGRVQASDGTWVDCSTIELVLEQGVRPIRQCIVVTHWTSSDIACLITLKSAAGSPGLALEQEGLDLASKSGSEAATVMSARSCAMFRRGLAQALERTNAQLLVLSVQVRRFQILREDFTVANGLLFADGSLNRQAILDRYRHLVDDMFQHEAQYPHKWMEPEQGLADEERRRTVQTSNGSVDGHGQQQPYERPSNPSISGYQHFNVGCESGTSTPRSGRPSQHGNYSREPSPRPYSREASPRYAREQSPRVRRSQQQRLPESVRALTMDGSAGYTSRDRGRYSPTFAAAQTSVRPFDKSAATPSIIPVGRGPLGLPVGGANFDGFARTCTTNIAGRPPRPAGGRQGVQGSTQGRNQTQPTTPPGGGDHSAARFPPVVAQNEAGEWAF